jgi:carboxyl-terminal processing protease
VSSHRKLGSGPLMGFALVVAFLAGMVAMHELGDEGLLRTVARVVQIIPGVLQIEDSPSIPAATDLRPLQTFWEVRDKVKRSFVYSVDDDSKLTYGAIRGMLASLDDPWTRFYTPEEYREFQVETEGHFDGIGAVLESREVGEGGEREVFITSIIPEGPASKVDIRPEDVIVTVDGLPTKGATLQAVVNKIRGKRGTSVKLGLKRQGVDQVIDVDVMRAEIAIPVVEYRMLDNKIGYVWLRSFNKQADTKVRAALEDLKSQGMKGLVFDLSINGGGLLDMAISVSSMFIDRGPVVYVQERGQQPEPLNALRNGLVVPKDIPVVVLTDHGSASASEITAACLQDNGRALVVGQNTFGKSKVQTVCELNDRSALVLSTAVYLTPKKRDISQEYEEGKRGVKPDKYLPDPDPNARIKYDEWHKQQIDQAVKVLEEQSKKGG